MTVNSSQNISHESLAQLFTSKARALVLRTLLIDPQRTFYQRQLELATGLAIRGVQRELERLTALGLLYRRMEGNRAYYVVDPLHPMFKPLRDLVISTLHGLDRLHAAFAEDESVRLVFVDASGKKVLVVTRDTVPADRWEMPGLAIESMRSDVFLERLERDRESLVPFLEEGEDLLGRREDVIWRRIEAAGFDVQKRRGIP